MIGVGVALGAILLAVGVNRLSAVSSKRPRATPPPRVAVVAARPIPRGRRVEAGDVSVAPMPDPAPAGVLSNPSDAIGRVALEATPARSPVLTSALAADRTAASLAERVPLGYRAISIQTDDEIAVSNLLQPGDAVDVQLVLPQSVLAGGPGGGGGDLSEASTLLQSVKVLSVGALMEGGGRDDGDGRSGASRTMTLAMTPDQVARFTLARSLGRFYLALRNPADAAPAPRAHARMTDIRAAAASAPGGSRPPGRRRRSVAPPPVELIVGGERQLLVLQ